MTGWIAAATLYGLGCYALAEETDWRRGNRRWLLADIAAWPLTVGILLLVRGAILVADLIGDLLCALGWHREGPRSNYGADGELEWWDEECPRCTRSHRIDRSTW